MLFLHWISYNSRHMFPISDSIKASRFPLLTYFFIVVNIYIFVQEVMAPSTDVLINQYALIPAQVDFSNLLTLVPFVTAIFFHAGFFHILSNMWFLFVFGDNVEDYLPRRVFFLLFILAGVIGNIVQYLLMPISTTPMLGASGAIAGILGCYYVLFPYAKVKTLIFIFVFITFVEISAPLVLGYWFILQLFSGAGSLSTLGSSHGGVAFFAHIAGFVTGALVGKLYKR